MKGTKKKKSGLQRRSFGTGVQDYSTWAITTARLLKLNQTCVGLLLTETTIRMHYVLLKNLAFELENCNPHHLNAGLVKHRVRERKPLLIIPTATKWLHPTLASHKSSMLRPQTQVTGLLIGSVVKSKAGCPIKNESKLLDRNLLYSQTLKVF